MSDMARPTPPAPPAPAWQRLKEIVAAALDLPRAERGRFLDESCGADAGLRAEAGSLSEPDADAGAERFLLHRRVDPFLGLTGPDPASLAGRRFAGKYELLRLIGQGAMAAVYLARQDGVERPVALKILRLHALGYDARRRFEREVQAQGRLDHPGIARIYDAGVWSDPAAPGVGGTPYIAMEYVDGLPLTRYADERGLPLAGRLRLLAGAADAVHAAHQRAIVHRDLKPANVLVAPPLDASADATPGRVKVLDFGIARVRRLADADGDAAAQTLETTAGVLLGTLGYMAPEQAGGEPDRVDVRSDVWSLGVMLHELLLGRLPVPVAGLPLTEALRRLGEPDVTAATIGAIPGDASGGDLTAVLTTALASEPAGRYPSAEALADDLRRVLDYQPVAARPQTRRYRARKFVRRHRAGVAAAAVVSATLIAGATVSTIGFAREASARRAAVAAQADAERALAVATAENRRSLAARAFVSNLLGAADEESAGGGEHVTLLAAIRAAEPKLPQYVHGDPIVEGDVRVTLARALRSLGDISEATRQYRLAIDAAGRVADYDAAATGERVAAWLWPIELQFELSGTLAGVNDAAGGRAEYEQAAAALAASDNKSSPHRPRVEFEAKRALAQVLDAEGRYAESADLWLQCLQLGEALVEIEPDAVGSTGISPDEIGSMQSWAGSAMISAGRTEEGTRLMRQNLAGREATLGPDNPATLRAHNNLAHALVEAGQLGEAEAAFRQSLAKATASLGVDHPVTMGSRNGLASTLISRQSPAALQEAVTLEDANIASYRRRGEDLSADAISTFNNRATALAYLDRNAEAADAYREAADRAAAFYGPDHVTTLILRGNLSQSLAKTGDRAAAVAMLRDVYAAKLRTLGPREPSVIITRNNVAMFDLEDGRAAEAAAELRACLNVAEEQGWGGLVPQFRRSVGKALTAAGDYPAAETALLTAYDELAELGPAQQAKAAGYLADLYDKWQRPGDAATWRERAAE